MRAFCAKLHYSTGEATKLWTHRACRNSELLDGILSGNQGDRVIAETIDRTAIDILGALAGEAAADLVITPTYIVSVRQLIRAGRSSACHLPSSASVP